LGIVEFFLGDGVWFGEWFDAGEECLCVFESGLLLGEFGACGSEL